MENKTPRLLDSVLSHKPDLRSRSNLHLSDAGANRPTRLDLSLNDSWRKLVIRNGRKPSVPPLADSSDHCTTRKLDIPS